MRHLLDLWIRLVLGSTLELGSFILMLYSAGIALLVAKKAGRFGGRVLALSLLLAVSLLTHGIHHAFAFFDNESLEAGFDFIAAMFALCLGILYVRVWKD